MFFDCEAVFRVSFGEVDLECFESECVAVFVLAVTCCVYLEALIGEMDEIIGSFEVIFVGRRAEVAVFVDKNTEVVRDDAPNSDVELAFFIQERLFNILLDNPKRVFLVLLKDKLSDVTQIFHNFNSPSLIKGRRFNYPHVLLAMTPRHSLISTATILNLSEAVHEHLDFAVVLRACNYISSWCSVEKSVVG